MGNYRFRLSDMMPNAWFYKLRDMSKHKNPNPAQKKLQSSTQYPRKSFYYSTDSTRMDRNLCNSPKNPKFFDTPFPYDPPPRKSKKSKRKTIYMPSPRKITRSVAENPVWLKPADRVQNCFDSPEDDFLESLSEFECVEDSDSDQRVSCSSATDIIIDVDETSYASISIESSSGSMLQYGFTEFDMISEPELPPIVTKPPSPTEKVQKTRRAAARTGRKSVSGVRVRRNGRSKKPETGRGPRKTEKKGKFYSESFAIVKASIDPEKDFRESMMEMIVENNIRASKDLEELLACYLSLNSNQYHDLIIKAFEQIWLSMPPQSL